MVKQKKQKQSKEKASSYGSQINRLNSAIKNVKEREEKEDKEFLNKRLETKDEREIRKLEYQRGLRKEKLNKEIRTKQLQKGSVQLERYNPIRVIGSALTKQKLLKHPTAKVPRYSGTRFVKQLASSVPVREIKEYQPREIVRDDRSLFFNEEFKNEKKEGMKWLGS